MEMQWWGHSKEHGWVVLDRSIAINAPGLKENLLFLRCRDSTTFVEKRKNWNPPSYSFAPNYIRDLGPELSAEAAAGLEAAQVRWPEFERQIHKEVQDAEDKVEAARLEAEKEQKEALKEKKKQVALAKKAEAAAFE